uniref:Uncharacterized protein n=1 Tax=Siphoviridae sp. ctkzC12 TaxID=2826446 RepID=A0A8S5LVT2_9CAUD|nr:MAG TPA: hypothetical protein [Siphoviridae sp. ctkzC12]
MICLIKYKLCVCNYFFLIFRNYLRNNWLACPWF